MTMTPEAHVRLIGHMSAALKHRGCGCTPKLPWLCRCRPDPPRECRPDET